MSSEWIWRGCALSAEIIDLRPILEREFTDPLAAQRDADRALHFAIQRHKAAYGEAYTLARLKQTVCGMEFVREVEQASSVE